MEVDVDLDEGLLQQVVGAVGASEPLHEEAVDGLAVAVEEVFEGDVVPSERQPHQFAVLGNDIVGYLHTRSSLRRSMRLSTAA